MKALGSILRRFCLISILKVMFALIIFKCLTHLKNTEIYLEYSIHSKNVHKFNITNLIFYVFMYEYYFTETQF